ncbi:ATP-dependent DNA helicase [Paraburkholderia sp. HP33-1]|uniref:ATP-dependent DNA helicase n=1 Tax=Paraburkholderia sp. HP33-1 TaxID=2883243 RepID=UPI001F2E2A76|nr:AAA family ATPase [Paraburkholderia sp. HP33-1]
MTTSQLLRVTSVRSRGIRGIGGCIFSGAPISSSGETLDAGAYLVVRASFSMIGNNRVEVGQWWHVTGECRSRTSNMNGYALTELQIEASELEFRLPSGEHIITLMAESDEFRSIGYVKARTLWETFGQRLYGLLDEGDVESLSAVLAPDIAQIAVTAWATLGDTRNLQWLQGKGFETQVGRKLLKFFGTDTAAKIAEDPYRLVSFCGTWKAADAFARSRFNIGIDDHRRLRGAVEEALYRIFASGHTCASRAMLIERLVGVLGPQTPKFRWRSLIDASLDQGLWNGSYVVGADDTIHPTGPLVMETAVASAIAGRILDTSVAPLVDDHELPVLIKRYESAEGISLNDEQREAIRIAATETFAVITGGAGVGKTTVLKAVYPLFDRAGIRICQMALAGLAAKRMQEATSRAASTIAGFLKNVSREDLDSPTVVVVDEASMIDIITMYRLCSVLPRHVRLLLIGDPSQLMPVGPGLVLHALVGLPQVASSELKVVKRYGGEIAQAALSIRNGIWPTLATDSTSPIAMVECRNTSYDGDNSLAAIVLRLYRTDPENTQILCSRRSGADGTRWLNSLCQKALADDSPMLAWSGEHESFAHTGFRLGDAILCTRNLWSYGLQNGSLGRVVQVDDAPRAPDDDETDEARPVLGWILWDDGERRPVHEEMLDDLELGYAITVHKAQGSQWPRVIVPVTGNRLMDRTLLYTAVTRAQQQVILVGSAEAAKAAVEALPKAHLRQVGLTALLLGHLQSPSLQLVKCQQRFPS